MLPSVVKPGDFKGNRQGKIATATPWFYAHARQSLPHRAIASLTHPATGPKTALFGTKKRSELAGGSNPDGPRLHPQQIVSSAGPKTSSSLRTMTTNKTRIIPPVRRICRGSDSSNGDRTFCSAAAVRALRVTTDKTLSTAWTKRACRRHFGELEFIMRRFTCLPVADYPPRPRKDCAVVHFSSKNGSQ